MNSKIIGVFLSIFVVVFDAFPILKDEYGREFLVVPLTRTRRDVDPVLAPVYTGDSTYKDKATRYLEGSTGNSENKFSSGLGDFSKNSYNDELGSSGSKSFYTPEPRHEITGKALVEKPFGVGVGLGYKHIPSGSELSADLRQSDYGADATFGGKLNLHKSENSQLNAFADYSQSLSRHGSDDSRGRVGFEFKRTW